MNVGSYQLTLETENVPLCGFLSPDLIHWSRMGMNDFGIIAALEENL